MGLVMLLGCHSTPEPAQPNVEVPKVWAADFESTEFDAEPSAGPWWESFDEPELDALIVEAMANHPTLRAAAAAIDQAVARALFVKADLRPQAEASFDAARREQVFVGLPIPDGPEVLKSRSTSLGLRFNVHWEVDLWGRVRAAREATASEVRAAHADEAAVRLSLQGQIAKSWFGLREAKAQVELARATLESYRQTVGWVEERYRSGLASALDVRLARSNQARATGDLEGRRRLLDASKRQLEILVGRYPRGEIEATLDWAHSPEPLPAGLPADLVARRPDLLARAARLEGVGWRLAEARAALFPRLSLTASGGTVSNELSDLLDEDFSIWNLAGGLLQPLFQGGRLRAAVDFAEASREALLADYAHALLAAFAEVETALASERFLRGEETALAEASEQAREAFEISQQRYREGVGTYLETLESQRLLNVAESRWLALKRQGFDQRVDLFLALGGELKKQ